jgi:nitrate reductase assembly molybdenum cofactor insertion protein NarJ
MKKDLAHYDIIAKIFEYPEKEFSASVNEAMQVISRLYPQAAEELTEFCNFAQETDLEHQQEIHTRTFDVQAITTLDLGYVLFGDDYKRGELLSNLCREHADAGVVLNNQLADHLPNLLRLIIKLDDEELTDELAGTIICPALDKIVGDFSPDKMKRKNEVYSKHHKTIIEMSDKYATCYRSALKCILMIISEDFGFNGYNNNAKASGFIDSIINEFEVEHSK